MLFKTIDEIKGFLPVNVSSTVENVLPFVNQAELAYIIPVLGQDQYDDLNDEYNAETPNLSDDQEDLLEKIRAPLANFAYMLAIPSLQLHISDAGIRIANTDQFKTAFPWQIEDLKNSFMDAGYAGIEVLLAFLEKNKTTYTDWASSTAYTIFKDLFIVSTDEFNKWFNIGYSRRTFVALRPIIQRMQDFKIKPITCSVLYAEIKTAINTGGTLDSKIRALLDFIQPAIAHASIARGISELAIRQTNNGLQVYGGSLIHLANVPQPAPDNHLANIQKQAQENADAYLKGLKKYLDDHVDHYPSYADSSCYTDPTTITDNSLDNHPGLFMA